VCDPSLLLLGNRESTPHGPGAQPSGKRPDRSRRGRGSPTGSSPSRGGGRASAAASASGRRAVGASRGSGAGRRSVAGFFGGAVPLVRHVTVGGMSHSDRRFPRGG